MRKWRSEAVSASASPARALLTCSTCGGPRGGDGGRNPSAVAPRVRKWRPLASKTEIGAYRRPSWIDRRPRGIEGRQTPAGSYTSRQSEVVARSRREWLRLQIAAEVRRASWRCGVSGSRGRSLLDSWDAVGGTRMLLTRCSAAGFLFRMRLLQEDFRFQGGADQKAGSALRAKIVLSGLHHCRCAQGATLHI